MEDEINHLMTKLCSFVKSKGPYIRQEAPMQTITYSASLEQTGFDFLHLDPYNGEYQYFSVIIDRFTRFTQAYQPTAFQDCRIIIISL